MQFVTFNLTLSAKQNEKYELAKEPTHVLPSDLILFLFCLRHSLFYVNKGYRKKAAMWYN